jgi:hypothetical protein
VDGWQRHSKPDAEVGVAGFTIDGYIDSDLDEAPATCLSECRDCCCLSLESICLVTFNKGAVGSWTAVTGGGWHCCRWRGCIEAESDGGEAVVRRELRPRAVVSEANGCWLFATPLQARSAAKGCGITQPVKIVGLVPGGGDVCIGLSLPGLLPGASEREPDASEGGGVAVAAQLGVKARA